MLTSVASSISPSVLSISPRRLSVAVDVQLQKKALKALDPLEVKVPNSHSQFVREN